MTMLPLQAGGPTQIHVGTAVQLAPRADVPSSGSSSRDAAADLDAHPAGVPTPTATRPVCPWPCMPMLSSVLSTFYGT